MKNLYTSKTQRFTAKSGILQLIKILAVILVSFQTSIAQPVILGGVNLGNLPKYLFVFTNGSNDANWQGATKGFAGNVAIDGGASFRTSGNVPFAGTISTNGTSLGAWQSIVNQNGSQATGLTEQASVTSLESDLSNAFTQINALPATAGYTSVSATSLNGLNTQDGVAKTYVINITSGLQVSSYINITGDAGDIFILRWDTDGNPTNGYQGQVKFQSGGGIVPLGGLKATNFVNVAGDINSSGGGSNPPAPFPQGPRTNDGTGSLISGASNFSGGGFFTGYWLTTGDQNGQTSSLSNGIFVGGWYSTTNKFSMTSGTSGVYVSPPVLPASLGDFVWNDQNGNGVQDAGEPGIPNVKVILYTCTGTMVSSTTTNSSGLYSFTNLAPGSYYVVFTAPAGYTFTSQYAGGNPATDNNANSSGKTDCVTLTSGQNNPTIDAGLYQPASIGDFVWNDTNGNGVQDSNEPGVSGVSVSLYTCAGTLVSSTTTNSNGLYSFTNLAPGSYYVMFTAPSGYKFTSQYSGGNPATDNNANSAGKTDCVTLASGQNNTTIDGGLVAIVPPPTVTVTQPICSKPTGTITVTAPIGSNFMYSINGTTYQSSPTFSSVAPNTYTVTVRASSNIVSAGTVAVVNEPVAPTLSISVTQPTCTVGTGSITVSATPPSPNATDISYTLSGTNPVVSVTNYLGVFKNVSPGSYTITAKTGGCTATATATVNPQPVTPPAPTVTIAQPQCTGFYGIITVTSPLGAGYSYSINDGINDLGPYSINPPTFYKQPGTYTLKVTNSCASNSAQVVINTPAPPPPAPKFTVTQPTCSVPTGSISISAPIGPTALSYTYSIDGTNFQAGRTFNGIVPGTYHVIVKNAAGCTSEAIFYINSVTLPAPPTVTVTQRTCSNPNGGMITITPPTMSEMAITVTGFNYDMIADAVLNTPVSSVTRGLGLYEGTAYHGMDYHGNYFFANGYGSGSVPYSDGLPDDGMIISSDGYHFQLAPYNGNNALQLEGNVVPTNGTLIFTNPLSYCSLNVLISAANVPDGGQNVNYQINFADGSNVPGQLTVGSWGCSNCTPYGIIGLNRVNYATDATDGGPQFGMLEYSIAVPTADQTKPISSITFSVPTGPSAAINVFALNGVSCGSSPSNCYTYSIDGSNYQPSNVFTNLATGSYNVTIKNCSGCISTPTTVVLNTPQCCPILTHNAFNDFNASPGSGPTTLWFNLHTKLSKNQLTSNGDYLLFSGGTITFTGIGTSFGSTPVSLPNGKIVADNTVSVPSTSFDVPTNTWITKVPLGYSSSDLFLSGAALTSTTGFTLTGGGKASTITGSLISNKSFSSSWFYGLACYQPTFTNSTVGTVNADNGIPQGGRQTGTPVNQMGGLVPGGSGGGGSNFTGSYSSTDNFSTCVNNSPTTSTLIASGGGVPVISSNSDITVTSVTAFPNPYSAVVNFNMKSAETGRGSLMIFDVLGRRVANVFEGDFVAGTQKTISYNVGVSPRQPLIYVFKIGNSIIQGKLIPGTE